MMMEQERGVDLLLSTAVDNGSSSSSATYQHLRQDTGRSTRLASTQLSSSSSLGVRKPPAKPWKKPGAEPPAPPKVYRVEPRGFRQLVQKLTGAAAHSSSIPDHQGRISNPTPPPPPPFSGGPALHQQSIAPPPSSSISSYTRTFRDAAPPPLELGHQHQQQQQQQTMVVPYDVDQLSPFQWSSLLTPLSVGGQQSPSLFSAYMAWASNPAASPTGAMAPVEQKCSTPLVN